MGPRTIRRSGRSSRVAGLMMLVVALTVVAIAPRFFVAPIGGLAVIGPIPRPPAVGDCVLEPVGPAKVGPDGAPIHQPVSTGPCTGHRFGEVVALVASPKSEPPIVSPIDGSVADPDTTACDDDVSRYLGIPDSGGFQVQPGSGWSVPPLPVRSMRVGPSAVQVVAGQRWVACVEYLDPDNDSTGRSLDYRRTARGTFKVGSPPAAFSTCLGATGAATLDMVPCHVRHPAELFAVAFGTARTSRLQLANSCSTLVARYTGFSDLTAGGRLAVRVDLADANGKPIPDGADDVSMFAATCTIAPTAGRQLTGPLMGLGNRPIPLD